MTTKKKLGIWMDNSSAHIMEFDPDTIETNIIESEFTHQINTHSIRHEDIMHNKEQRMQGDYYKKLSEVIKNYDEVVLFGPTNAKAELYNILKEDHLFAKIKIETRSTDNMSENQQHAFVKDYFSNH